MTRAGSPLYQVSPEHAAAVVALVLFAVAALIFRRRVSGLAPMDRLLLGLLAASAAIHIGLAVGHVGYGGGTRLAFLADAVLLALIARRVARGPSAGKLGVLVLVGSILAYWASALGGEPPDQLGLATKLAEILALAIIVRPRPGGSWPRAAFADAAVALLVVGTAASSWIGAFRASAATHTEVAGHHVHAGSIAPPGSLIPIVEDREPTAEELRAANGLLLTTRVALARYSDPRAAAADGYKVDGLSGLDFHAPNPEFEKDGRVLDPARPETLVYAVAPDGRPVLMGALFQMQELRQPGPMIGGPLTVWHAHEHICVSLLPLTLTGLLSPLGGCPLGSIDIPMTAEMIHIWIVPGAPQPYGDLSDDWKRGYLQASLTRP